MARTLSQDLRGSVIAAIDGGLSCRAAADRFGVSASSAIRWRQRALAHGEGVAKPRGGDRHSGRIEAHGGFIRELLAEQGDNPCRSSGSVGRAPRPGRDRHAASLFRAPRHHAEKKT